MGFQSVLKSYRMNTGRIEMICGSMFSGKTAELLRRMERARIARLNTLLIKPAIDTRYHETAVVSHNTSSAKAIPVGSAKEIFGMIDDRTEVLGIDEAQFFDDEIVDVVTQLADQGIVVILAGLDTDYRYEPFGSVPQLLALADRIDKFHAICVKCGAEACRTQRLSNTGDQIQVGEMDTYEARCRNCFETPA